MRMWIKQNDAMICISVPLQIMAHFDGYKYYTSDSFDFQGVEVNFYDKIRNSFVTFAGL